MTLLELDGVSVSFGGVAAVSDLSLRIEAGEIRGMYENEPDVKKVIDTAQAKVAAVQRDLSEKLARVAADLQHSIKQTEIAALEREGKDAKDEEKDLHVRVP